LVAAILIGNRTDIWRKRDDKARFTTLFAVFPDPRHSNGRLPPPDRKTANVKNRYNIDGMRHKAGSNRCYNLKNLSGSLKWTF
jgi:hypothetical protein